MPRIETKDGTSLYVKDWGTGKPVVLIHGWPLNADMWEHQARALAEAGHRVVSYDRRGFGRSDQPLGGYDYDTLSDDLAVVIEASGLRDAALVGFSMGGGEVARYMSRHGGRGVDRVAFVASVVPGMERGPDNPKGVPGGQFDTIKDGLTKDRPEFLRDFARTFYGVGTFRSPVSQGVLDWSWGMAMQASPIATTACVDAFGRTDFSADIAAIGCPALIVHGTDDQTVPAAATGERLAAMLPDAVLKLYDGAPHGLPVTHADELNRDLLAFLG